MSFPLQVLLSLEIILMESRDTCPRVLIEIQGYVGSMENINNILIYHEGNKTSPFCLLYETVWERDTQSKYYLEMHKLCFQKKSPCRLFIKGKKRDNEYNLEIVPTISD
jgi:hypothetical protein